METEFGLGSGKDAQGDESEARGLGNGGAYAAVSRHQREIEQRANQAARQPPQGRPIQPLDEQEAGIGQVQDPIKEDPAGDVGYIIGGGMKAFISQPADDVAASSGDH